MPYSQQIVAKARQQLASMKADRESRQLQALQQAYREVPRLQQIDMQLRRSMTVAAQTVFATGGDAKEAMEQVKKANLVLQQERAQLVQAHFAPGFLDETPICADCGGSGYVGSRMCSCLQQLCLQEQRNQLRRLTGPNTTFGDFRLDLYPGLVDANYGASPRQIMEQNLKLCRRYADSFGPQSGNLLFVGGTGLGKTFLSACIANEAVDKGYWVAYESAPQLFSKLERERFDPTEENRAQANELRTCDLLIIDDLGTELPGNFVTAALYALLNERLMENKSMLISTNLNIDEIAKRYSGQIASRLQGSFRRLTFVGQDIRVLKNK